MQSITLIVHVALAVAVIGLVLIQHGKGADAGAAFGSGASSTVFGARGSASFLTRLTTILAALFFVTSLILFYLAAHRDRGTGSVTDSLLLAPPVVKEAPQDAPSNVESDLPAVEGERTDKEADTDKGAGTDSQDNIQFESDMPATQGATDESATDEAPPVSTE